MTTVESGTDKFSAAGELTWAKTLGGSGFDWFDAVAVTSDGGLIATGLTMSADGDFPTNHGGIDAVIARFSADGELTWAKTLGGSEDDRFDAVAVTSDGGLIATGLTSSADGDFPAGHSDDNYDAVIARFNVEQDLETD
jgi:hypothetical protein